MTSESEPGEVTGRGEFRCAGDDMKQVIDPRCLILLFLYLHYSFCIIRAQLEELFLFVSNQFCFHTEAQSFTEHAVGGEEDMRQHEKERLRFKADFCMQEAGIM